jgi:hypothetical protein
MACGEQADCAVRYPYPFRAANHPQLCLVNGTQLTNCVRMMEKEDAAQSATFLCYDHQITAFRALAAELGYTEMEEERRHDGWYEMHLRKGK